jgi:hypothetical protein
MRASIFRVARRLRSSLRTVIIAVLIVGVTTAVALAVAAGAQRTASAPDRYARANPIPFDATIMQSAGPARTAEIAALPGVRAATAASFVMGFLQHGDESADAFVFAGDPGFAGTTVIAGRLPATATEFVATDTFVHGAAARIGDRFHLVTVTQAAADAAGFAGLAAPDGPQLDVTLVGELGGRATGDPSRPADPLVVFPASLLDVGDIGIRSTPIAVRLDPGTSVDDLTRSVAALTQPNGLDVSPTEQITDQVRAAVSQQARSLWILDGIFVLLALVLLGQLLSRAAQLPPTDERVLRALGYDRTQMLVETTGWLLVVATIGVALGGILAALASGLFPTGFVRRIDPNPGLRPDLVVLSGGAALILVVVVCVSAALLAPRQRTRRSILPARFITALGALGPNAAASTGVQLAFVRGRRDRFSVFGGVMTVGLLAALLVASLTVGTSLHRFVVDPAMSGAPWDLVVGGQGETNNDPAVIETLRGLPDVVGVTALAEGAVSSPAGPLQLIGIDRVRGATGPTVTSGRLPSSGDEIAIGRLEQSRLHVGVGDDLVLTGHSGERTLTVVGVVVVPSIGGNAGVGHDAVVTMDGFSTLIAEPGGAAIAVDVAPRVGAESQRQLDELGAVPTAQNGLPDAILELNHADGVPQVLSVLLGLLLLIALGHLSIAIVQRRSTDVAVLSALGADRLWLTVMSHAAVTAVALVALPLSVPVGAVIGARVFRSLAQHVGGVDRALVPWALALGIAAAAVVGANVVSALPALQARHRPPADVLTGE